jgi:hypothetical protein
MSRLRDGDGDTGGEVQPVGRAAEVHSGPRRLGRRRVPIAGAARQARRPSAEGP